MPTYYLAAIRDSAAGADADSVFYFYSAGHGVKGGCDAYVANYDIQTTNNASTGNWTFTQTWIECLSGSGIRVLWNGKAYDAKVLKEEGGFHYITYPGYGAEWNEWLPPTRIKKP